jgi:RNA polymerase sigma-70 factor (ECF subfamily)
MSTSSAGRPLPFPPLLHELRSEDRGGALAVEVGTLYDELQWPLRRYLRSLGLAEQDTEEVAQEVFLALFRHLRSGRACENVRGWIFRVGHNLGLKRRAGRETSIDERTVEQHWDPGPNPEQQAVSLQRQERLLAVVRVLPEQDRLCLLLRAEGLRYREICEVLGMSLGAVSISLTRSIARLARADER